MFIFVYFVTFEAPNAIEFQLPSCGRWPRNNNHYDPTVVWTPPKDYTRQTIDFRCFHVSLDLSVSPYHCRWTHSATSYIPPKERIILLTDGIFNDTIFMTDWFRICWFDLAEMPFVFRVVIVAEFKPTCLWNVFPQSIFSATWQGGSRVLDLKKFITMLLLLFHPRMYIHA